MAYRDQLVREGDWLFRWRSYLPLAFLVPLYLAMTCMEWPMHSRELHEYWEALCFAISLLGFAVRIVTAGYAPEGTSGRNTKHQVARTLNTTGMYSVVRNPLYLGNFLIWLGIALFSLVWWFAAIFVLAFWLYYERIVLAEEDFLRQKFGESFEDWASKTPVFIPRLSRWTRPATPFSLRRVLRKEYTGLFGIAVGYFVLELVEHLIMEQKLVFELEWTIFGGIALVAYLTLMFLKKRTRLLRPVAPRELLATQCPDVVQG